MGIKINTGKTSINTTPSTYNLVKNRFGWEKNTKNLDFGAGKYHTMKNSLAKEKVKCFEFDKYNRKECPATIKDINKNTPYDTATLSNVLNVCPTESERARILHTIRKLLKVDGKLYITIYEGNRSGIGKVTSKGYQENKKTNEYLDEIKNVFTNVEKYGKLIVAYG